MDDPTDRSRRRNARTAAQSRRPPSRRGFVVTQGVAGAEEAAQRAGGQAPRGSPVAVPENHIALIMRHDGTEYEIGEGQLRSVDMTVDPAIDIEVTAFGDMSRRWLPSTRPRRHITIRLEVDE